MSDTNLALKIEERMSAMRNDKEAAHLRRFFKTGKGEYGEGDNFLGIRVPATRAIVKEFRKEVVLSDIRHLLASPWHEIRLAGFLLLIEIYQTARKKNREQETVEFYLANIERGNNWDLVDLVAPKILGDYIARHPEAEHLLDSLADRQGKLWHQRVAIVATWALIREGSYDATLRISKKLLRHHHDLIHKAVGWMLREMGKRGGKDRLLQFLDIHAAEMPRTMLRYSLEHFPDPERRRYMAMGRPKKNF